jgi:AcrR family transcriptional regulator
MPLEQGQETRKRILVAAADVFAKEGFRRATVASIAHSAGLNAITVYRYFPKKKDLFWEAIDSKLRHSELLEHIVDAIKGAKHPGELIERMAVSVAEDVDKDPLIIKLLLFAALELESQKVTFREVFLKPMIQVLTSRIQNWNTDTNGNSADAETAAIAIVGLILSRSMLVHLFGISPSFSASNEEIAREYAALCVSGLNATAPRCG